MPHIHANKQHSLCTHLFKHLRVGLRRRTKLRVRVKIPKTGKRCSTPNCTDKTMPQLSHTPHFAQHLPGYGVEGVLDFPPTSRSVDPTLAFERLVCLPNYDCITPPRSGQFLLLSTPVKFARRIFDRLSSHQRFRRAQLFNFSRPRLLGRRKLHRFIRAQQRTPPNRALLIVT